MNATIEVSGFDQSVLDCFLSPKDFLVKDGPDLERLKGWCKQIKTVDGTPIDVTDVWAVDFALGKVRECFKWALETVEGTTGCFWDSFYWHLEEAYPYMEEEYGSLENLCDRFLDAAELLQGDDQ